MRAPRQPCATSLQAPSAGNRIAQRTTLSHPRTRWNCTRCQRVPSFKVNSVVFDPTWSLLAYIGYLPEKDAIVVVFRGSDNHVLANWMENLR
jgi:hypothetical protein